MPDQVQHDEKLRRARYVRVMRLALPLLLLATPAFAQVPPHSGVTHTRRMPELSDVALFVMAVGGVWLARRALRKRFKQPEINAED